MHRLLNIDLVPVRKTGNTTHCLDHLQRRGDAAGALYAHSLPLAAGISHDIFSRSRCISASVLGTRYIASCPGPQRDTESDQAQGQAAAMVVGFPISPTYRQPIVSLAVVRVVRPWRTASPIRRRTRRPMCLRSRTMRNQSYVPDPGQRELPSASEGESDAGGHAQEEVIRRAYNVPDGRNDVDWKRQAG
ncbi:hypothetical protein CALVIDRAFT_371076 [Calocera viscosa TUFC12733]|uniref:Uncharacterized protein n=1 Tax=Calocera viscosa (strain TUFC12733) TaxID=1330018 RepID=A0A167GVZ9_CALVF|nr:hypothetical protein CALVIDRAFT_371076 [Calocera viscosa TUFC12733]